MKVKEYDILDSLVMYSNAFGLWHKEGRYNCAQIERTILEPGCVTSTPVDTFLLSMVNGQSRGQLMTDPQFHGRRLEKTRKMLREMSKWGRARAVMLRQLELMWFMELMRFRGSKKAIFELPVSSPSDLLRGGICIAYRFYCSACWRI